MPRTCAVISDVHIPHQDETACALMKAVLAATNPETVILNGDIVDFAPLSHFLRAPAETLQLQNHLNRAKQWLLELRACVPQAELVFLLGNHEERLQKYLFQHPEVESLDCLKLSNLLDLPAIHCQLHPTPQYEWEGWLITHGDVVRAHAGQTAQAMIAKYGSSGVCGHVHRLAQVTKKNFSRQYTWVEGGCLCKLTPDYMKVADWQHGFTLLTRDGDNSWADLVTIQGNQARTRGLTFTAS